VAVRIVYLINAPGAHLTGAGRRTLTLARREGARGHDVLLVAPPGSGIHEAAETHGLRHLPLSMSPWPFSVLRLRRAVRDFRPDVVHGMSFVPVAMCGLTRRRRPSDPRVFVSILVDPGSPFPMDRRHWRSAVMRFRNALARRSADRVDAIFTVSAAVRDHLAELGVTGRTVLARDTIDIPRLRERATRPVAFPEGRPRIGMAAVQLVPFKGSEYLVRAFERIVERYPEAVCLVAGEPAVEATKSGSAARVHLLGFLEEPAPFIAGLDVYVMPSLSEGLNTSVLEALTLERPVVATAVGGLPEAVIDGVTGLLVPPADADALADAILRLLDDPALARRLASQGRARVEQHFGIERFFEVTEGEYARALAAAGRGDALATTVTAPEPAETEAR
jgi:glycosyltransferase involved in cell wall biosynthesis